MLYSTYHTRFVISYIVDSTHYVVSVRNLDFLNILIRILILISILILMQILIFIRTRILRLILILILRMLTVRKTPVIVVIIS